MTNKSLNEQKVRSRVNRILLKMLKTADIPHAGVEPSKWTSMIKARNEALAAIMEVTQGARISNSSEEYKPVFTEEDEAKLTEGNPAQPSDTQGDVEDELEQILADFELMPRLVDLHAYDAKLKLKQALEHYCQQREIAELENLMDLEDDEKSLPFGNSLWTKHEVIKDRIKALREKSK
jgi:hypothetical protein